MPPPEERRSESASRETIDVVLRDRLARRPGRASIRRRSRARRRRARRHAVPSSRSSPEPPRSPWLRARERPRPASPRRAPAWRRWRPASRAALWAEPSVALARAGDGEGEDQDGRDDPQRPGARAALRLPLTPHIHPPRKAPAAASRRPNAVCTRSSRTRKATRTKRNRDSGCKRNTRTVPLRRAAVGPTRDGRDRQVKQERSGILFFFFLLILCFYRLEPGRVRRGEEAPEVHRRRHLRAGQLADSIEGGWVRQVVRCGSFWRAREECDPAALGVARFSPPEALGAASGTGLELVGRLANAPSDQSSPPSAELPPPPCRRARSAPSSSRSRPRSPIACSRSARSSSASASRSRPPPATPRRLPPAAASHFDAVVFDLGARRGARARRLAREAQAHLAAHRPGRPRRLRAAWSRSAARPPAVGRRVRAPPAQPGRAQEPGEAPHRAARVALRRGRARRSRTAASVDDLVGRSPAMQTIRERIRKIAGLASTVLITGESGVGKELIARAIHKASPRRDLPVHRHQLLGAARDAARVGALRAREGGVHRRLRARQGEVRAGPPGDALPRRDRRHEPLHAGQDPARARGEGVHARGRLPQHPGRRAAGRRDQRRPAASAWPRGSSARTSTTGSRCSPSRCRRSASGRTTCPS